jgi:glycosyltransferase involved in cell wall biosynthesis
MKILIIHEIDWMKKVVFEPHHLSELFSIAEHDVFVIDVPDPGVMSVNKANFGERKNIHRTYKKANVSLIHTPIIPIKGVSRVSAYMASHNFIKKIIKEKNIDVVFMYSIATNAKAAIKVCKELKIPIIHRTFDIIHELVREEYLRKKILKIEKEVYPLFDRVIANTPHMEQWSKEMGSNNTIVIPQGVDSNLMKPLFPKQNLLKQLGISSNDKVVMYLGSIESFSGLNILLEQIPQILEKIPEFKLLIVGGGSHLESIKNKTKQMLLENKIIFTGYVPYLDVPKYASLAKICVNTFVINSMTDKLSPVKIFDLMSCGKTIIATPLSGLLFDFPQEEDIIIYSELEDFEKNVISALNNPKIEDIGKRGREFIKEKFSWEQISKDMLKELSQAVK